MAVALVRPRLQWQQVKMRQTRWSQTVCCGIFQDMKNTVALVKSWEQCAFKGFENIRHEDILWMAPSKVFGTQGMAGQKAAACNKITVVVFNRLASEACEPLRKFHLHSIGQYWFVSVLHCEILAGVHFLSCGHTHLWQEGCASLPQRKKTAGLYINQKLMWPRNRSLK